MLERASFAHSFGIDSVFAVSRAMRTYLLHADALSFGEDLFLDELQWHRTN